MGPIGYSLPQIAEASSSVAQNRLTPSHLEGVRGFLDPLKGYGSWDGPRERLTSLLGRVGNTQLGRRVPYGGTAGWRLTEPVFRILPASRRQKSPKGWVPAFPLPSRYVGTK